MLRTSAPPSSAPPSPARPAKAGAEPYRPATPAASLDASHRLGHHLGSLQPGGYDLARPSPPPPPALAPGTPIQRNGDGSSSESEDEPMEMEEDEWTELRQRGGKAMKKVVTQHQPQPGGKIDSLLDSLYMMHGYHGLHEEHNDPVVLPEPKKAEEGKKAEEEEEEEEEPEVIRKKVTPGTKSPYTHNTSMLFANLAQSYVHGVGTYEPNAKGDGSSVAEYLGDLPKEIGTKDVLSLVSAPSFQGFNQGFETKRPAQVADENAEEEEKERVARKNAESDDARTNLWSISQLMDLESARRRSGGVMNAIGITQDLAEEEPDAKKRLVEKNVLSHEGASGKSVDPSPGKFKRLEKSNDVMTALLEGGSHPDLDRLRKRMSSFVQTAPKLDAYAKAKNAWYDKAEIDKKSMRLGVSKKLRDDEDKKGEHVDALKADPSFQKLQASFGDFMRGYYDPAQKKPGKKKDLDTTESVETLRGEDWHFLTWMVNKAAAAGHQDVLSQASQPHGLVQEADKDPEPRHEASEFVTMFGANEKPETASKLQHVANLRRAHEMSKESQVFGKSRLHANNRGRHFRPGFGRYENLSEEIVQSFEQLHSAELHGLGEKWPRTMEEEAEEDPSVKDDLKEKKEKGRRRAHKRIGRFVDASSKDEFTSTSQDLEAEVKDYETRYKAKEEALYQEFGVGKGARLSAIKRTNLMEDLGITDELIEGVDAFRPRVKKHVGFRAIEPKEVRKSARALTGARDVYRGLETDRDHEAGAMNELIREEGVLGKDQPLDPNSLLNVFNIMSPQGVNTSAEIKSSQYETARRGVKLKGPFAKKVRQMATKRKQSDFRAEDVEDDSRELDEGLENFYRKKLKGNFGEAIKK